MRVNFGLLAGALAAAGAVQLLIGNLALAGVLLVVSVFFFIMHRDRVKRFRAFDQAKNEALDRAEFD